jgi:protein tyrosine/serine phosphatase
MQDAGDSPTRWLHLQGACNTRDLGGLRTPTGLTRAGVLLRSDDLQGLTPRDVDLLTTVTPVSLVIDLRSVDEVRLLGPGPLVAAGIEHVNLPVLPRVPAGPLPHGERVLAAYRGYVEHSGHEIRAALALIAEPRDGAVLVHCAAGKDRTGVVVALALSLAGVPRETVVADYLATSDVVPAILARLRSSDYYAGLIHGSSLSSHLPRADTMLGILADLDAHPGGLEGWAGDGLAAALRERLIGD